MGLEFSQTCPDIDRSIESCKEDIKVHLRDILDEVCPLFNCEEKDDLIDSYSDHIYNEFAGNFELVRETNEDMRSQANYQIDLLEDEIYALNNEIKDLKND